MGTVTEEGTGRGAVDRRSDAPGHDGEMASTAPSVVVRPDDALEDVLGRLPAEAGAGRAVGLAIPADSALFLTASEFRALKDVADRGRLAVAIRSPDPHRLRLARMLGFDATGEPKPPSGRPAPSRTEAPPSSPVPAPTGLPVSDPPPPSDRSAAVARPSPAPAAGPDRTAQADGRSPVVEASATGSPVAASGPVGTALAPSWPPRTEGGAAATSTPEEPPRSEQPPPTVGAESAAPTPAQPIEAGSAVVAAPQSSEAVASTSTSAGDWPVPPPPSTAAPRRRMGLGFSLPKRRATSPPAADGPGSEIAAPILPGAVAAASPRVADGHEGAVVVAAEPATAPPASPPAIDGQEATAAAAPEASSGVGGEGATVLPAARPRSVGRTLRGWRAVVAAHRGRFAIGAAVALAALAAIGVALGLPRADVGVVLRREPVRAEVVYDVTDDGEPLSAGAALAVAAEPETVEVTIDESVPTTGVRLEPDGTAGGSIRLANPTSEEVTVEAGTVVSTESGVEFAFAEEVTVPAADPDAGDVGAATGEVRALEPGGTGNVETGEIGGRLPNGVYYSNRDGPTDGGTDREIRVVAPEDLETLTTRVEAAMPAAANAAFARELSGATALPGSFSVGRGSETFEHEVGDDADSVAVTAVRSVTALVYDRDAVRARLDDELGRRLAAEVPRGFALDPAAVELATPQVVDEAASGTRFRLRAEAEAEAVLDAAERRTLADRLAGADPDAIEAIMADAPEIDRFSIEYRPGWLPDRMPGSAGRIEIEAAR